MADKLVKLPGAGIHQLYNEVATDQYVPYVAIAAGGEGSGEVQGTAPSGQAAVGNPVLVAGIDSGANAVALSVESNGKLNVASIEGVASETTLAELNTKTPPLGQSSLSESVPVVLASDQPAVPVVAELGQGVTASSDAGYEAFRVIKASPGRLMSLKGYNSKVSAQFIQIHNSSDDALDGAVPVATFTVPATSNFAFEWPASTGLPLSIGIIICNSSTGPTKTVGSADCFFTAVYI